MHSRIFYAALFVLMLTLSSCLQATYATSDAPINVSKSSGESYRAQILVDGDYVYLVWTDKTPGNADVFFTRSLDGGKIFETPINLSNNNGSSAFPRLAISGANVYVTWYDYSPGQSDIFFAKSKDRGASFESINLSNNSQASYNPWVAMSGNNVYVVWNNGGKSQEIEFNGEKRMVDVLTGESEILLARSNDGGSTFETINLSNTAEMSWNPRIAVDGNNTYVAWNEGTFTTDIFFAKSTDYGRSFSDPINVSRSNGTSLDAGIALSKGKVHIIWTESVSENSNIFYAKSEDEGITFGNPTNLSNSKGKSNIVRDTEIAAFKDNIYVVWYDDSAGNYDVFFARSTDNEMTFNQPINLSQNSGKSELAQIAISEENVYVIWNDYTTGNADIFLRKSHDGGETFGSVENLSNDTGESFIFILGPQIATTNEKVFTVWESNTKEGDDLFLKVFSQTPQSKAGLLYLQTTNGKINVQVDIDKKKIEQDKTATFALRFLEPSNGKTLQHVNYSFYIQDAEGNKVINRQNQYAETGIGFQNVTISKTGPFILTVQVNGLGIENTYDTKYSGITSAVITVVPEFPYGIGGIVTVLMLAVIILHRFKPHLRLDLNKI